MKLFEVELKGITEYKKNVFADDAEQAKRAILTSKFYRRNVESGIATTITRIREIKPKVPIVFEPFFKY